MQGIRLEVRFHTSIEIVVECSKTVVVRGEPFITLDAGTHDGIARYQSISGSNKYSVGLNQRSNNIIFKYTVGLNQRSFELDSLDVFSVRW